MFSRGLGLRTGRFYTLVRDPWRDSGYPGGPRKEFLEKNVFRLIGFSRADSFLETRVGLPAFPRVVSAGFPVLSHGDGVNLEFLWGRLLSGMVSGAILPIRA